MATTTLRILLVIGLLAAGKDARAAASGVAALAVSTSSPDTARVYLRDAGRARRATWSRRDPRLDQRGGQEYAQKAWACALPGRAGWLQNKGTGAPVIDPSLWGANGNVLDITRSGNTLYIAGSFRSVGENSGGFVPINARTGEALAPFPKVAGFVHAIVPDGSGGWYIGGQFTAIGGKPHSCLAQIRADGSVSDWNPSVTGSPGYIDPPAVSTIVLKGNRLYVGGGFREIGGEPRENIGCVDAQTGAVVDWKPDINPEGWVYTLATHDSTVFVGGFFSSVGGQPRNNLAAVDAVTGVVRSWQATADGSVEALLVHDDTLLVGGKFGWIAGSTRQLLAAIDINTAQLLPFDAHPGWVYRQYLPQPQVDAMALVGDTLFVAGNFTHMGGQYRPSIAALNVATAVALDWSPDSLGLRYEDFPPPLAQTLAVDAENVYVGGWFELAGGQSRPFVAALDRATGRVTPWNPKPDLAVSALAVKGDTVYVCGEFSLVGEWKHRSGLAAIDLATGTVKPWNPNPDGGICTAVAVHGGRVFVSGDFSTIGGDPTPRSYFAALDTVNGEVTDWNPGANSLASVFMVEGDTLYAGGEFTTIGGQPRNYLAAIGTTTGDLLPWNPDANLPVLALARNQNTIYVGGLFDHLGGEWRKGIGAVGASTGAVIPWSSDTDNDVVEALLLSGNTLYVGGGFAQIGGQPRQSLAALDATTGSATSWYPQLTSWGSPTEIKALALLDGTLYVGGVFGSVSGQTRICLAAVDTATGLSTGWDAAVDGFVWSLANSGDALYVGGGFTRVGGVPATGLAAFALGDSPASPLPPPAPFELAQNIPNPAQSNALIRFTLPNAASVTLSVYDIHGRRVVTPLENVLQTAGPHEVPVQADRWKPGIYFYRLEAGGQSATRKMVVVE